eukprot:1185647-Prorocentrum_minimum.AAC.12
MDPEAETSAEIEMSEVHATLPMDACESEMQGLIAVRTVRTDEKLRSPLLCVCYNAQTKYSPRRCRPTLYIFITIVSYKYSLSFSRTGLPLCVSQQQEGDIKHLAPGRSASSLNSGLDADDDEFNNSAPFSSFRQLRALMWRHWLLKRRTQVQTLTEVLSPIVLICLLVLAYSLADGKAQISTNAIVMYK